MGPLAAAQYGFAPALASALLHSLWQIALIAGAAALTLAAMARRRAAARHSIAMAFLLAMVLVPAAQFLALWGRPGGGLDVGLMWDQAAPQAGGAAEMFVQASSPLAAILVAAWLAGVGLMLARHIGGIRAIAAMERGPFEPLPPVWQRRADELRAVLRIGRTVAVRLSAEVASPFAARLIRPVIWLPLSMLSRVPAEQVEALLAHELAHIARRDWLWNGIQCVIEALLFYHPAAWWLGRRIRQEREHACDDLAVAACGDAIALAEALSALECERQASPRLILAAKGGSLMKRITRCSRSRRRAAAGERLHCSERSPSPAGFLQPRSDSPAAICPISRSRRRKPDRSDPATIARSRPTASTRGASTGRASTGTAAGPRPIARTASRTRSTARSAPGWPRSTG